jgi:uncharacterized protein (DUF1810 family)
VSLDRFIEAQDRIWPAPLDEIRAGRKITHWMWFVWPQLRGLGPSEKALHYGIRDLDAARAYLADPVLGPRLKEISDAILLHEEKDAAAVLGPVDAMKLRSSATLFEAAGGDDLFSRLLDAFFAGQRCEATLNMIGGK